VNTLTRCGHAVEAVETGAAALDALEADEYDVVLMDIEMPEMDGIEATRRMRKDERFVDLPVIALTAHALAKDRDRCLAAGMDAYISKPFNRQKMLDTLAELTGDTTRGGEQPPDSWSRPESEAELPIDADALIDTAGGDRDFAISLVEEFLQMTRQQLLKMQTAIKDSDYEELQTIGHSLKGAAGTVHAQRLSETAERLEDAAAERDCDSVKAIRCAIQDEVSALEVWAAANLEHGEPPLGRAS
jgi:CheY-like chemotaxis protein